MIWYGVLAIGVVALAGAAILSKLSLRTLTLREYLPVRAAAGLALSLPLLGAFTVRGVSAFGWTIVVLALLVSLAANEVFFAGIKVGSVAVMNGLQRTAPLHVVWIEGAFLGVLPAWLSVLGVALILVAVSIMIGQREQIGLPSLLLGGLAGALTGASFIAQAAALHHVNLATLLILQNAALLVIYLPLWLSKRDPAPPRSRQAMRVAIGLAIVGGLLVNVVATIAKLAALPHVGPLVTACVLLLSFPAIVVLARFILREPITRRIAAACAVLFAGALLCTLARHT